MTSDELVSRRLLNQRLTVSDYRTPEDVVSGLLAMQSQEYAQAKWAIGMRLPGSADSEIEKAFNDGKILRTHVMRPTWHFVSPRDIRWLVKLTAPRVQAFNAFMYRKMELTSAHFNRCNDVLIRMLEGNKFSTRSEIKQALGNVLDVSDGVRLACILMNAELENLICSGPKAGKQFTYALTDERLPETAEISDKNTLYQLSERYFASRGPATVRDFSWWCGLNITECKRGADMLSADFKRYSSGKNEYIFKDGYFDNSTLGKRTFLLPDYDEYGISYKDRSSLFTNRPLSGHPTDSAYYHMVVIDGLAGGWWKQSQKGKSMIVELKYFKRPGQLKQKAVRNAIRAYGKFLKSDITVQEIL